MSSCRASCRFEALVHAHQQPVGPIRLPESDSEAFVSQFNDLYFRLGLQVSRASGSATAAVTHLRVDPPTWEASTDVPSRPAPHFVQEEPCGETASPGELPAEAQAFLDAIVRALGCAFEGQRGKGDDPISPFGDIGLLARLDQLSAADASRAGQTSTCAQQIHQLCEAIERARKILENGHESLAVAAAAAPATCLDAESWQRLRDRLKYAYIGLLGALKRVRQADATRVSAAVATVSRVAFHASVLQSCF